MIKGYLERVPQRIGTSWRYQKLVEERKSYAWHRHAEYEVVIHRHFEGSIFVGHHQSEITHNHIVMIGPGVPHAVYSTPSGQPKMCETHIVWFRKDWIEQLMSVCQELSPLRNLLFDGGRGLQFSPQTAEQATQLLDGVCKKSPANQIATLISFFGLLLDDKQSVRLTNLTNYAVEDDDLVKDERLESAEAYLLKNFAYPITLSDVAKHLFTSETSVRRLFRKHFNESFVQRLKKIRLNIACELLMSTDLPIQIVLEKVGYESQANFNRQFKQYKRVTPSVYRAQMRSKN
ncbi:helix-turn-helix domain-containing protein [Vibrio genomosp. F10]|uniref:helix-turn-helix domain-containing protein n=1 Tax=Vibrio genomosp. F10 TaxID=723171 RepID=UPI00030BB0EA|nr:AraC family transcriptional regulator [Vibrio genomosp. F10]OEF03734.1 AraC family transcriptional regulator [Vibrio genomosp. F10 str. 9ZB36]